MRRNASLALIAAGVLAAPGRISAQSEAAVIRVGTNPVDPLCEPYYGSERGIFRDNGANVQVTTLANGSTTVQGVVSGDLDAGIANIVQVAAAVAHGIPLQMIAPAALYSAKHAYSALCVAKNAPFAVPKDLIGATFAVSTLNDFNQLAIVAWLEHNGISPAKVRFVELRFAEMGAALQRGTVQAATIAEPALSGALYAGGVRTFADIYSVIAPEFANLIWFSTKAWLQKNPDAAKHLVAGIYATARWANAHQPETGVILARIAKIDPATVAGMRRAYYATSSNPKYVQAPLDFSFRYGLIARPVTTAEFIAS